MWLSTDASFAMTAGNLLLQFQTTGSLGTGSVLTVLTATGAGQLKHDGTQDQSGISAGGPFWNFQLNVSVGGATLSTGTATVIISYG